MLRCKIELLPMGNEEKARTIGLIEIANVGGSTTMGNYRVVLTKTPPFNGALKQAWKKGLLEKESNEDESVITGSVIGHHRIKRGSYDLLYRALKACGLDKRNP